MDRGSLGTAAGLAVPLQPWGLVAAGALTVVEADISHFSTWLVLFAFRVLATATLLAAELYMVCARAQAQRRLLDMRTWMEKHEEQAIVVGSLVIGLWLTGKSIYELTGRRARSRSPPTPENVRAHPRGAATTVGLSASVRTLGSGRRPTSRERAVTRSAAVSGRWSVIRDP
ncbi:GAP family protein [Streptomyces sp. NPDC052015]|uniref:GAP family protein n=1 Tax=Streptomyces sp. NPDC052015 TaxID=3154755 RepID=UPI00341C67AE